MAPSPWERAGGEVLSLVQLHFLLKNTHARNLVLLPSPKTKKIPFLSQKLKKSYSPLFQERVAAGRERSEKVPAGGPDSYRERSERGWG